MILVDTGPLIALLDRTDPAHERCTRVLPSIVGPMITTWPCITEAMHLLGREYGFHMQGALWRQIVSGVIVLHDLSEIETRRMGRLMETYQNVPMDLADASIVAIAEALNLDRVFTLDSDFRIYRTAAGKTLEILP